MYDVMLTDYEDMVNFLKRLEDAWLLCSVDELDVIERMMARIEKKVSRLEDLLGL